MAEQKNEKKETAEENIFPDLKNEALVEAMNKIKENENPETQTAFVTAALGASYFAPVNILDANDVPIEGTGKMQIPGDAKFNFRLIRNMDGEQFFPLFTDIPEFQKWNKEEKIKTIVVTFPQMVKLAAKKKDETGGLVLNPMGQNLIFKHELIDSLMKHLEQTANRPEPPKEQVKILFGKPANIPDTVLDAFRKTLSRSPELRAVYFLMMKQDEREHYLFVFDSDLENEPLKKIADSFCASARLFLSKFPVISAPLRSPLGENAPKVTEPFYKKEA
ncbi:MAG: enhanced serine sensitivity protein SseB [Bacteroides sp.]|nr:enhanced serine sensitivity protein SseB [Eubacterium sp.]MCM1418440.1 enhanced serine sensitivity protein SseB [Roseburia sp.]MCM1462036.1 enhanced serine sensitivity protein SseB [Bacteroides sp.]